MPFPTTQWGNIGNPLNSSAPTADIYSTQPGPSASVPGSANGPVLGNYQILADGTAVQFLKTTATTPINSAMTTNTWTSFQVTPTTGVNQGVVAANDRTSSTSVTANYYTWFTVRGLAYILCKATLAKNAMASSSATGGTLDGTAVGSYQGNLVNTILVGGSDAASPVLIL